MRKFLAGGAAALALGTVAVGVVPVASAGPFCDFFDVAGLCDVRDAIKACSDYPQACEQYSPPTVERQFPSSRGGW